MANVAHCHLMSAFQTSGLTDILADLQHGFFWFQGTHLRNVWAACIVVGEKMYICCLCENKCHISERNHILWIQSVKI